MEVSNGVIADAFHANACTGRGTNLLGVLLFALICDGVWIITRILAHIDCGLAAGDWPAAGVDVQATGGAQPKMWPKFPSDLNQLQAHKS